MCRTRPAEPRIGSMRSRDRGRRGVPSVKPERVRPLRTLSRARGTLPQRSALGFSMVCVVGPARRTRTSQIRSAERRVAAARCFSCVTPESSVTSNWSSRMRRRAGSSNYRTPAPSETGKRCQRTSSTRLGAMNALAVPALPESATSRASAALQANWRAKSNPFGTGPAVRTPAEGDWAAPRAGWSRWSRTTSPRRR